MFLLTPKLFLRILLNICFCDMSLHAFILQIKISKKPISLNNKPLTYYLLEKQCFL